ncbi:MAG TPA: hypothetical protein P5026_10760 [Kiritimatiellia bacterium]|nr:hypothetical protein [Kiritimatiellia bacterium]HRU71389.1 hypothetical protein [Kiritimatiellia bacterium]
MILDDLLMFSKGADLETGTRNAVDLKDNGDDLSRKLNYFVKVEGGAVADGTSLAVAFQTSADNSTWTTLVSHPAVELAAINADGFIVPPTPLPTGLKRYVCLSYTTVGTFTGTGKIHAGITPSLDKGL